MSSLAPFVGPPTLGAGCAYSADIDRPACGEAEQVHILVNCSWGVVALSSCTQHAPIARASGDVRAEHAYGSVCADQVCWKVDP